MDFHHAGRQPAGTAQLPSINIVQGPSGSFEPRSPTMSMPRSKYSSTSQGPSPISIRGSDDYRREAPPPLPPPPRPMDEPQEYRSSRYSSGSFSSGFGSTGDDRPAYMRRLMDPDEGYGSLSSTNRSFPGFGSLHDKFRKLNDMDCDTMMKNKLNPIRTIDTSSRRSTLDHRLPPLTTVGPILEEDDRFTTTPLHSAVSPRAGPFRSYRERNDYRDRGSDYLDGAEYSPTQRSRRKNSGSYPETVSTRGSFDNMHEADEMDVDGPSQPMGRLRIDDYYYTGVPSKRRASSPADETAVAGLNGLATQHQHQQHSELLLRRREHLARGSPTPRLSNGAHKPSSLSSHGSYVSTMSNGPSSLASLSSFGRRSPGAMSPGGGMSPITSEASCNSPFQTPISLNPSPRGSLSTQHQQQQQQQHQQQHQRTDSRPAVSPRKLTDGGPKMTNGHKLQDFFMCECCPKKPKKFDTMEELKAHEAEKQYGCSFCGNRFKNKNEAERHQNSLHVRRHSWSCKAMTGYNQAFHESAQRPGEADTCGYCGKEFERTGHPASGGGRLASEKDWEDRISHLTETHKFRECNSSKKFYRADHFRQHLKHSHAGSSGKWTNMLENACMVDEEPPTAR